MANIMEFVRGDGANHTFAMPASSFSAGGHLFFAAKTAPDDDNTDALAFILGDWTDSSVIDVVVAGIAYKKWACHFPPAATNSIVSNGAGSLELLGEFEFVPLAGDPITFPPTDDKIPVVVYFDLKRKTVV